MILFNVFSIGKQAGVICFSHNFTSFPEEDSIRGGRGMLMARGQRLSYAGALANMRSLTCYEKAKALCRTSAFKSENPFFKVAMSPSYVHTGYKLVIFQV
jgi:hypothetical protein